MKQCLNITNISKSTFNNVNAYEQDKFVKIRK